MKDSDQDILNMMDILDLLLAIDKCQELIVDPNLCNYMKNLLYLDHKSHKLRA